MNRRVRLLPTAALAGASFLAGCGDAPRDEVPRAPSASSPPAASASSAARPDDAGAPGADTTPACPLTGLWAPCSVQDRMDKAGLVARATGGAVRRPGFAVPGRRYAVGEGTLELFLYRSVAERERDLAALDSATASPRGGAPTAWPHAPTLVTSTNLMAVLYDVRERQAERVVLALTAGLPTR